MQIAVVSTQPVVARTHVTTGYAYSAVPGASVHVFDLDNAKPRGRQRDRPPSRTARSDETELHRRSVELEPGSLACSMHPALARSLLRGRGTLAVLSAGILSLRRPGTLAATASSW